MRKIKEESRNKREEKINIAKVPLTCSVCIFVTDLALLRHVDRRNRISTPEI
jgi:hypothetical protein